MNGGCIPESQGPLGIASDVVQSPRGLTEVESEECMCCPFSQKENERERFPVRRLAAAVRFRIDRQINKCRHVQP